MLLFVFSVKSMISSDKFHRTAFKEKGRKKLLKSNWGIWWLNATKLNCTPTCGATGEDLGQTEPSYLARINKLVRPSVISALLFYSLLEWTSPSYLFFHHFTVISVSLLPKVCFPENLIFSALPPLCLTHWVIWPASRLTNCRLRCEVAGGWVDLIVQLCKSPYL